MTEQLPVTFKNADGQQLIGILDLPSSNATKLPCILLLSPGVKMRVAPHRMYNKMAAEYAAAGFAVLRFDFTGLGDAEGEIEFDQLSHVYNSIQLGRFVADTLAALDYMKAEHGFSRFIAGGLCGGAITGLLAAQQDTRIVGLLALGIPVVLDVGDAARNQYLTKGELDQLRHGYIKKIFDPRSWLRFLSFKSDYRVILRSIKRLFEPKQNTKAQTTHTDQAPTDNTNPHFAPAFFAMAESKRPQLHVFSGADRLAWEFKEKFQDRFPERLQRCQDQFEIHTIDKANHILAHPVWFSEMLGITRQWLGRFQ